MLIDAVFGLASAFARDFTLLLGLRLLTGIGVGGTLPVDYAMMAEFLPPQRRGRWLVALEGFWAVGTILVALAAWAASLWAGQAAWRWLFAATGAAGADRLRPAFLGAGIAAFPAACAARARRRARCWTGSPAQRPWPPGGPLQAPHPARTGMGDLLTGALRRRTLLILLAWLLVSIAYYGVFIWLPGRLVTEGYGFVRGYGFWSCWPCPAARLRAGRASASRPSAAGAR